MSLRYCVSTPIRRDILFNPTSIDNIATVLAFQEAGERFQRHSSLPCRPCKSFLVSAQRIYRMDRFCGQYVSYEAFSKSASSFFLLQ